MHLLPNESDHLTTRNWFAQINFLSSLNHFDFITENFYLTWTCIHLILYDRRNIAQFAQHFVLNALSRYRLERAALRMQSKVMRVRIRELSWFFFFCFFTFPIFTVQMIKLNWQVLAGRRMLKYNFFSSELAGFDDDCRVRASIQRECVAVVRRWRVMRRWNEKKTKPWRLLGNWEKYHKLNI